jgi:predicted deacylase
LTGDTRAFDPIDFAGRLEAAARAGRFTVEHYGEVNGCPLLALFRKSPDSRTRVYLSAGIHGDEPAPPIALLSLLETGAFGEGVDWFLCPMLNPAGLAAGTRANGAGVDLNRDYRDPQSPETRAQIAWLQGQPRFDLTLCLHEDWEPAGFYIYEQNPEGRPSLAEAFLQAAATHCPIEMSPIIDGREAHGGVIRTAGDLLSREKWPEAIYLRANHTSLAYTVETPSSLQLGRRVAALKAVVSSAIEWAVRS